MKSIWKWMMPAAAVALCSANPGAGTPMADSVKATATPTVAPNGPAPPVNHGKTGLLPKVIACTTVDHVPVVARTRT